MTKYYNKRLIIIKYCFLIYIKELIYLNIKNKKKKKDLFK